jgi:serine/threonine protein phosphatase PrpC
VSKLVAAAATDVGLVRTTNQDQVLVSPGLYAVADGMGGHAAGEVASMTAVHALQAAFEAAGQRTAEALDNAARAANHAIWEQARANREMLGMGTTLVALALVEREDGTNGLAVAHIGDSRVYQFREGTLHQLTVDHSLVQELVDDGQISEAQAAVHPQRNVLTRALGIEPAAEVDLIHLDPARGDRYLLCSDGLSREVTDDQIAAVLRRFQDPTAAAKELVALARSQGGSDNITVVVVDVMADSDSAEDLGTIVPEATSPVMLDASQAPDGGRHGQRRPQWPHWLAQQQPGHRLLTFRFASFVAALAVVIGGAIAGVAWYARSTYFVGLQRNHIAIFRGHPGGVLWFGPTLAVVTSYTAASVLPSRLPELQAGVTEPSLAKAWTYIDGRVAEKEAAVAASRPHLRPSPPRGSTSSTTTPTASSTSPTTPTASSSSTTTPTAISTTLTAPTTTAPTKVVGR